LLDLLLFLAILLSQQLSAAIDAFVFVLCTHAVSFCNTHILLSIFGTGLIFLKRLEAVITSGEVPENIIVFRLLVEGPAGVDKTVREVVPEAEGAEIGAIFRGAVSIRVVDSLVSEMEKK
jgi:hypothetical protein